MRPAVLQGNSGVSSLGAPDDWTHHHLIFSNPGSFADAVRNGSFESWYRVASDPRYIMQLRRRGGASNGATTASALQRQPLGRPTSRNGWRKLSAGTGLAAIALIFLPGRRRYRATLGLWLVCLLSFAMGCGGASNAGATLSSTLHGDWAMSLQAGGSIGNGMFPAKFTFDVNATPDCKADYVAFNTGHTASAAIPSIIAFDQLYSTQGGNCLGNAGNGTGPQVKWAYWMNTGTGAVVTSPVLSLDGTKIVYVETSAGNFAILRLLKWKPGAGATVQGTLAAPSLPDTIMTAGQNWTTNCPAANSCIASITFNGNPQDTTSAPFYNYATDNLYVGDSAGRLHKFTGVFGGTPSEVTTGWPITVNAAQALTGPVFDSGSGNIFVGDASGRLSYVREVGSTKGACGVGSPPCLGSTNQALGGHIVDPPIVDSANGTVFVFDGQTGAGFNTAVVRQTNTALTTIATVTFLNSGSTTGVANMHPGTFNNAYFTGAAGSGAGKLYVCAQNTAHRDYATLFRISFTAGTGGNAGISVMNSAADAGSLPLVNLSGEDCSPMTEINNTAASTEWIFWSVGNHSIVPTGSACATGAAGCLLALNLTTAPWPPLATGAYWASFQTPAGPTYTSLGGGAINAAGTSGIVVDNVANAATFPQASSIYFSFTSNSAVGATCNAVTGVGCAIKLTQSGLN